MSQQFASTGEVLALSAKLLVLSMLLTAFLIASQTLVPLFYFPASASIDRILAPFAFAGFAVALGYLPAYLAGLPIWVFFASLRGRKGWSKRKTALFAVPTANIAGVAAIFLTMGLLHRVIEGEASPYPLFGGGELASEMFMGAFLSAPIIVKLFVK